MAKLIRITETAEAITAEAMAYVWEAYDAPRKRVPRARIVEHRFTVTLPKYDEDAAPLAFVIEHHQDGDRPAWEEPIRYAGGKLYAPVSANYAHRYGTASKWKSADPREYLTANTESVGAVSERERDEYADRIARHDVRADEYPARYYTADKVEKDARRIIAQRVIIGGEIWEETNEPVYEYYSADHWGGRVTPAYIGVRTEDTGNPGRNLYGAQDVALDFFHADTPHASDIRVYMPELVTVDRTARDLAQDCSRTARNLDSAREKLDKLEKQLAEARVNLAAKETEAAEAIAKRDKYAADPRAFWVDRAQRYGNSPFASTRRAAERINSAFAKEA